MQKRKQKFPIDQYFRQSVAALRSIPRHLRLPLLIVLVSVVLLATASVRVLAPGRACVNAPVSPYPSLQVIAQGRGYRADHTVTNRHIISCISDDLRHLPEMPATGVKCPISDGSTYILNFDGGRIVTGSLSGCQAVKIQGNDKLYYLLPNTTYTRDMHSKLESIIK